ncbi:hypothetical protein [Acinetobacter puyangensis]|uniref:hypothetical protein n=1 Tax=Acinetobacter puyangensis TaxID=1096779 RepID=UPI003A4E47B7
MNPQIEAQLSLIQKKVPRFSAAQMIVQHVSDGFTTLNPKAAAISFATAGMIAQQVYAADGDIDLGIDAESLKSLILGLIATIAVIGTAYITVLVGISAFSLIRRVVRG